MKSLFVLSLMFLSSCSIVGPQEKAVHTFMGKPVSESSSGATLWLPFLYGNTKFDMSVQKHVVESTASSRDLQPLDSHIAVNWRISATDLTKFYKDVGDENDAVNKIIDPAVNEVFKASTAVMTAEEIVSRRVELKKQIDDNLQTRLDRYGLRVDDVSIVDVKFSDQFIQAIEAKQISEQQTKQAQYIAEKAKVDAQATVNAAHGQADAELIKAKAEAEANKLKLQTLTPELIQYEAIGKWDGKLPTFSGGGAVPFINVNPTK